MKEQGDSLVKERDVRFALYFPTEGARDSFAYFARGEQLNTAILPTTMNGSLYGIIVSKYAYVNMESISLLSNKIFTEAKKYKGYYYKGWTADLK
jgi:hypothetical protein